MTVTELAAVYQDSANRLRDRIGALRVELKTVDDPVDAARLRRRIADMQPLWKDARDTAKYLANYYGGSGHGKTAEH